MNDKQFEIMCKKLDKIMAVLVVQAIENKDDKIYALKKMGLSSYEISPLVGVGNVRDTKGWRKK